MPVTVRAWCLTFNHAIIAIALKASPRQPAELDVEGFGRLLIFDPTDPHTRIGRVPAHEQGSYALVDASSGGKLIRVPVGRPEDNKLQRRASIVVKLDMSVEGTLEEKSSGRVAAGERSLRQRMSSKDYDEMIQRWAAQSITGIQTKDMKLQTPEKEDRVELQLGFTAPNYVQPVGSKLFSIRPTPILSRVAPSINKEKRESIVHLDELSIEEDAEVEFPDALVVDELPDAGTLETQFGTFSSHYEVKGNKVLVKRRLSLLHRDVPVEEYRKLRAFLALVNGQDTAVIMLKRREG
jgi:hypothetical protein